jgi:hypothetical protein
MRAKVCSLPQQLDAGHLRHPLIGDHNCHIVLLEKLNGFSA